MVQMTLSVKILVFTASLLILGISVVELAHWIHFGHFIPFGLHADAVIRKEDLGIPGITKT
jgi:hypothetical protein